MNVTIRKQQMSDANRFFDILSNPHFLYWAHPPKTLEDEQEWLHGVAERWEKNMSKDYAILLDGEVVGGLGIKIYHHYPFTGEIGYFLDEAHWGKGIVNEAVRLAEKEAKELWGLSRIEIIMNPENTASERVAQKAGYEKEGVKRQAFRGPSGMEDVLLYAKIIS